MRRLAIFVMVFLIAALPLRGMAAFAADPCAGHHGVAAGASVPAGAGHGCDQVIEGDPHAPVQAGQGHDGNNGADRCAHCAACAAGCGLLVVMTTFGVGIAPGQERIPFYPPYAGGHFPTLFDRPPLAL